MWCNVIKFMLWNIKYAQNKHFSPSYYGFIHQTKYWMGKNSILLYLNGSFFSSKKRWLVSIHQAKHFVLLLLSTEAISHQFSDIDLNFRLDSKVQHVINALSHCFTFRLDYSCILRHVYSMFSCLVFHPSNVKH